MKIWLDDVRPAPNGYVWCHSVNKAIEKIKYHVSWLSSGLTNLHPSWKIELIDCDHDLGDYAFDGGDGIKLLDWLEEQNYSFPIHIHSMNPVGRQNMMIVVEKNNWRYIP